MATAEMFYLDIRCINVAHEFELNQTVRCDSYLTSRKYYGVIFAISGDAEYRFSDGRRLMINPGEMLLLSSDAAYTINTIKPFKHYTVNFELHKSSSSIPFLQDTFYLLHTESPEWYRHAFKNLVSRWSGRKIGYEMQATAELYALLAYFCTEVYQQKYSTRSYQRLSPAKEYIDLHFDKDISLILLSNLCDMSITHFRREWKKLYSTSPLQYRDALRLSYAKEYLAIGYYSVTEIAQKCGFENANYFIRFFKKHTGITPGNYIQNKRSSSA